MGEVHDPIRCLLSPRSVAIVGASADAQKLSGRPLKYLLKYGYLGRIYPVNPKYSEVGGYRCFPSVDSLPEPADTAFVIVPAAQVPDIIERCARRGVPSATIFTAGFAETGAEGLALQREVVRLARVRGVRLCGPNCIGVANLREGIVLSASLALEMEPLPAGAMALISQSGGMMGSLLSRAQDRHMGFSFAISTGNEADLEVSDFLEYLAADDATRVILVYLETLRNGPRFLAAASMALRKGKRVVVLKTGRSAEGRAAALTHTGAMAGSHAVFHAACRRHGLVEADSLEGLLETASLLAKVPQPSGGRAAVISTSGGSAVLLADLLGLAGLNLPPPPPETAARLRALLPSIASASNPLDVTFAGVDAYEEALRVLLDDPMYDMVVAVVGSSSQFFPEVGVGPIARAARSADKPLVSYLSPSAPESLRVLEEAGVPTFRTPEQCARSLRLLADHAMHGTSRREATARPVPEAVRREVEGLLQTRGEAVWDEVESKSLLRHYGIPTVREEVCSSFEEAVAAAGEIGYPVILKGLLPGLAHKSEHGLVQGPLHGEDGLSRAWNRLMQRGGPGGRPPSRGVVQEFVPDAVEVIAGITADSQLGPACLFGMGGTLAELYGDVTLRLVPIDREEALQMVREIKAYPLLEGYRGTPPRDVEALAGALERVSWLAADFPEWIESLDVNPLMVRRQGEGVLAVDALLVTRCGSLSGGG